MSTVRIVAMREWRSYRAVYFAHFLAIAYLILTGTFWVHSLYANEGGFVTPVALWARMHGALLPLLCVFATLRTFATERSQGTLDALMTAPVPHQDIVTGKFLAAFLLTLSILAVSALAPALILPAAATGPAAEISAFALAAALVMLLLQAATWTALGLLLSVIFRSQALIAAAALLLAGVLPISLRALPAAYLAPLIFPERIAMQAADGTFNLYTPVCYLALTPLLLFLSARVLDFHYYKNR